MVFCGEPRGHAAPAFLPKRRVIEQLEPIQINHPCGNLVALSSSSPFNVSDGVMPAATL
jgi:hypothetical protein